MEEEFPFGILQEMYKKKAKKEIIDKKDEY